MSGSTLEMRQLELRFDTGSLSTTPLAATREPLPNRSAKSPTGPAATGEAIALKSRNCVVGYGGNSGFGSWHRRT
jgi:hypothetical protein